LVIFELRRPGRSLAGRALSRLSIRPTVFAAHGDLILRSRVAASRRMGRGLHGSRRRFAPPHHEGTTRRANHSGIAPTVCPALRAKIFRFRRRASQWF